MNFAFDQEKRYENSRFAHFYTNSFALICENFTDNVRNTGKSANITEKMENLQVKVYQKVNIFGHNTIPLLNEITMQMFTTKVTRLFAKSTR